MIRGFWGWSAATPGGVLVGVLVASVLCAVMTYPQAWVVATAAGVLLVLGLGLPGVVVRGVSGSVEFSAGRCRRGDVVGVRLEVVNRWPTPVSGVEVVGVPGMEGGALLSLPARGRRVVATEFAPTLRGEYPGGGGVELASGFPLGLRRVGKAVEVKGTLLVWPGEVGVDVPELDASARVGEALLAGRRPGTTGDLTGLRPYRRGDAVREIHWRQTARHGRLIVRERQSPATPRVSLVLDTDSMSYDGVSHRERAIDTAASLLLKFARAGLTADLVAGVTTVSGGGPGGCGAAELGVRGALVGAMDHLARLGDDGPSLAEVLLRLTGRELVVVTSGRTATALRAATGVGTQWVEVRGVDGVAAGGVS